MGSNPASVVVADVDGDGDLDILTASYADSTASVRLNQVPPPPTITGVAPSGALVGTSVVITGTNFTAPLTVSFNGTPAPGVYVSSATQLLVPVPVGATSGPFSVTTPGGTATSTTSFTVLVTPTVTSTSPARNANAAPRPGNVVLTYSQLISAASPSNVRVFSAQAGGRKAASYSGAATK